MLIFVWKKGRSHFLVFASWHCGFLEEDNDRTGISEKAIDTRNHLIILLKNEELKFQKSIEEAIIIACILTEISNGYSCFGKLRMARTLVIWVADFERILQALFKVTALQIHQDLEAFVIVMGLCWCWGHGHMPFGFTRHANYPQISPFFPFEYWSQILRLFPWWVCQIVIGWIRQFVNCEATFSQTLFNGNSSPLHTVAFVVFPSCL